MRLSCPNLFILASLAELATAVLGPAFTSSIPNGGGSKSSSNLISFELLSHKTVWERNRRERHRRLRRNLEAKKEEGGGHFGPDERIINTTRTDPTIQLDALYQGYGTHYVDLWVGTPTPQRQTVIVDTGSSITAFPCTGCGDCGKEYHTDDYFDYEESVTFEKLTCSTCNLGSCKRHGNKTDPDGYCHIHHGYAEGSTWTAFEATDYVYAGGSHHEGVEVSVKEDREGGGVGVVSAPSSPVVERFETRLTFGCQTVLTGLFKTQLADGTMGMGESGYAFWSQMHSEGIIPKQRFSLCFSRQPSASRSGTHAGVMTMGGYDPRLHKTPVAYAANVGAMSVQIKEMYLRRNGGESAHGVSAGDDNLISVSSSLSALNWRGGGDSLVDSGHTDTYFNRDLLKPFKKAWKEATGWDYNEDYDMELTREQMEELPTIILRLKGAPPCDGCDDGLTESGDGGGEDDDLLVTSRVSDEDTDEGGNAKRGNDAANAESLSPPDVFLAIPATHYLYYRSNTKTYGSRFCMDSDHTTLGANIMQGHDVVFDVENGRIGFAESDCDYSSISVYDNNENDEDEEDGADDVEEKGGTGDGDGTVSSSHSSSFGRGGTCSSRVCQASVAMVVVAFFVQLLVISKAWSYSSSFFSGSGVGLSEREDSSNDSVDCADEHIEAEERQPIIEDSEEI